MFQWNLSLVYFVYGLAFFSMGLAVWIEGGRASDRRLRRALQPLAVFGFVHGGHEWMEMFQHLGLMPEAIAGGANWEVLRLMIIALSLLPLAAFGSLLFALTERLSRMALAPPVVLTVVWGIGTMAISMSGASNAELWPMLNAWTRYALGVPGALLAAAGLVVQQREFRRAGLIRFGRDSLWAAVAFFWYGAVGQVFIGASALPPSNIINQDLFFSWFGIPIQILRAGCAVFMALFVIRFLRAFEVETRTQIAALQSARLEEAQRREAQRGELLRRVVAAQEAERQRIARELHDVTGQSLTALGLGLHSVVPLVRQDPEAAEQRLGKIEGLTSDTLEELRHLIADLRPSHLDDLGLGPALRWYAKEVEARTALHIGVEVSGTERALDPAVRIALFRIAQEAITNAVKHSGAAQVSVQLCFLPEAVGLRVEDNGCGFALSAFSDPARPAWGLMGMRERAALLHGRCDIYSRPQDGTRVEVTIPGTIQEAAA